MAEAIERLRALRIELRRQGKGHDAQLVARCIRLVTMDVNAKNESQSAPDDNVGKSVGKKPVTACKPS